MAMPSRFVSLLAGLVAFAHVAAQVPARTTVEQTVRAVVDSFFTFTDREQWDSAATLFDTSTFGAYVRTQVRQGRGAIPMRSPTAEDLMARDSSMSRAVAEWQLQRLRASAPSNPFAFISHEFLGVETPQQLSELTTLQALARWIATKDHRVIIREAAKRSGCPLPAI